MVELVDFFELRNVLFDQGYFTFVFPFLLVYALIFTVLSYVKIFQNKEGIPFKPILVLISLIFSLVGVTFEISPGYRAGDLLMLLFPNISSLTIGILALYIVGSMLGANFFKGLFRKDISAFVYFAGGIIGLGSVVYYVGLAAGLWNTDPFSALAYWNTILVVAFGIIGAILIFVGMIPIGFLFLFVVGSFLLAGGEGSILAYFFDPIIFIIFISALLFSWASSPEDEKIQLKNSLINADTFIKEEEKRFGRKLEVGDSRLYDINEQNFKSGLEKWKKRYGDENWHN